MKPSVTSNVVLVGLVAGLAFGFGCSSGGGSSGQSTGIGGGGMAGSAGSTAGASGTGTAGAAGAAGSASTAGTSGAAGAAGAGGTGSGGGDDITKVAPTPGCGNDPGQAVGTFVMFTIPTSGTKADDCADSQCGNWSYLRQYFVKLPLGYDNTKAYPLIFEGPGAGGTGNNLYGLPDLASTVIRVGLTPPPNSIGHATNPGQGWFDDHEGDDSVEWPFYENLYDRLATTLCFDKNRVFAAGITGGAWLANELGCKYAGDPTRPVRGVLVNHGGLLTDPRYAPTCTDKPMAGMWVHAIGSYTNPIAGNIVAIDRALIVNGCTPAGVTFKTATFDPFPISATDSTSCKKIKGCPDLTPLVICPIPSNSIGSNDAVVNPGWSTFIKLFSAPPLLTP